MSANLNFDATQVEPDRGGEPLPAGDYMAIITNSEMKPNSKGTGEYLELTMQVTDGPHAGRQAWDRLSLIHQNAQPVDIAQRKLSAICHAVGVLQVTQSEQLHNRPLKIRMKPRKDDPSQTEVASYKSANGSPPSPQPAAPAPPAQPAQPAQQPATSKAAPPWARKAG